MRRIAPMTETPAAKKPPVKGDDRNLVAVENGNATTFEEKLLVFWKKNRNTVVVVIIAGIATIVGRGWWHWYVDGKERETRAAYGLAETIEQKAAFARENAGHPTAALALLEVADDAFARADYNRAASDYRDAAVALADPVLKARARLAEGVAGIRAGSGETAFATLLAVAEDSTAPEALRCEAWFQIAAARFAAGQNTEAKEALDQLEKIDSTGRWIGRAGMINEKIKAVTTPVPAVE
jgi:predicted negative regulator of RcsB-dependent stress response